MIRTVTNAFDYSNIQIMTFSRYLNESVSIREIIVIVRLLYKVVIIIIIIRLFEKQNYAHVT